MHTCILDFSFQKVHSSLYSSQCGPSCSPKGNGINLSSEIGRVLLLLLINRDRHTAIDIIDWSLTFKILLNAVRLSTSAILNTSIPCVLTIIGTGTASCIYSVLLCDFVLEGYGMLLPMKSALMTSDVILLLRKRKEASRRDRGIAKCFGRTNVIPIKMRKKDLECCRSIAGMVLKHRAISQGALHFRPSRVCHNVVLFFHFLTESY